jgi:deoxyadenosine/deoxycytidine kinase
MLERPDDNPFLERFYADMPGYALQAQLAFLFQRLKQLRTAAQPGMFNQALVSDYIFAKDALFARLTLSDEEYRLYAGMYAQAAPQVPVPDLVIWLQASPATLLARVRRRAIAMEQAIDADYLQRLCDLYVEFFHSFGDAPVLAIGTEQFNPGDRDEHFALLLERIASFRGPREFFDTPVELPIG